MFSPSHTFFGHAIAVILFSNFIEIFTAGSYYYFVFCIFQAN